MEEQKKEDPKGDVDLKISLDYWYKMFKLVLIIIGVVALGLVAVNQALAYRYKAVFLKGPCELCSQLNVNASKCIENCFTWRIEAVTDIYGNLRDQAGNCYTLNGIKIKCKGEPEGDKPEVNFSLALS
jgi:hypothetical protein